MKSTAANPYAENHKPQHYGPKFFMPPTKKNPPPINPVAMIAHLEAAGRGIDKHHDHLFCSPLTTEATAVAVVQLQCAGRILRLECERFRQMNPEF